MYDKVCKFCGESGLTWEQTLNNRWILLDKRGQKHSCIKPKINKSSEPKNFRNDPKINKALGEFKKTLDSKKTYWLKGG